MKSACSFLCLLLSKPKLSLPRILCHSGPTWASLDPNCFCISYISYVFILYLWFYFGSQENLELHGFKGLACQAKKTDARDCFSYMELGNLMLISGFSSQLQKRRSRSFALQSVDTFSQQWEWGFLSAVSRDCSPEQRDRCSVQLSLLKNFACSLQSLAGRLPFTQGSLSLYQPDHHLKKNQDAAQTITYTFRFPGWFPSAACKLLSRRKHYFLILSDLTKI